MPWSYIWVGTVALGKEYPFDQAGHATSDALDALVAVEPKVTCLPVIGPNRVAVVVTDLAADEGACDTVMAGYAP